MDTPAFVSMLCLHFSSLGCACWWGGLVFQGRKKGVVPSFLETGLGPCGKGIMESQVPSVESRRSRPWGHVDTSPWSHRLYVGKHEDIGEPEGPFKTGTGARPCCLILKALLFMLTTLKFLISNMALLEGETEPLHSCPRADRENVINWKIQWYICAFLPTFSESNNLPSIIHMFSGVSPNPLLGRPLSAASIFLSALCLMSFFLHA